MMDVRKPLRFSIILFLTLLCTGHLRAQIVNIEELRITGTNDSTRWYGTVKAAATLTKIAQQSLQIGSGIRVQYKHDPHMVPWLANGTLLRAGQQDFTRQLFGHVRYNYKINSVWSTETFVQVSANPVQLLQERSLVGAGLRFRALKSKNGRQRIYLGAAALWERNRFSDPFGTLYRQRFSGYFSLTLKAGKYAVLYSTTYYQPVWGLAGYFRFSTEWNLQVPVGEHLSFTTDYTYGIDRDLPEAASAYTYTWINGLMWHF